MNAQPGPGPALVVLAAGLGRRFGGPKQIESVGPSGEILLDYSVFDGLAAGFQRVVFVVRDEVEAVLRERLGPALAGRCAVDFATQRLDDVPAPVPTHSRTRPWGTGHAVLACRDLVDTPFAVVNADDFYGRRAFRSAAGFLAESEGSANALVGYPLAATLSPHGALSRAVCHVDAAGDLVSIAELHGVELRQGDLGHTREGRWRALPRDVVASINCWAFQPELLAFLWEEFARFLAGKPRADEEFGLPSAIGSLIARGKTHVRVLPTDSAWLGITHRQDLDWVREALRARVAAGEYPSPLWGKREPS